MLFLQAVKDACFVVFPLYVALMVLARLFAWRRCEPLPVLGITVGCVLGVGLAAQLHWGTLAQSLLMGLMVGICHYLFSLLEKKPLRPCSARS